MSLIVELGTRLVTIQDLGRAGHMHEGIPPGGAAVRAMLIAANREAANRDDAPALELAGAIALSCDARIEIAVVVASDRAMVTLARAGRKLASPGGAMILDAGDRLLMAGPGWAYVAVRGGIAVPEVLGGHGTLPGIEAIRKGQRIESAGEPAVRFAQPPPVPTGPVRVLAGPDHDAFEPDALARLCAAPYKMLAPSRVGARLMGAAIARVADYRQRTRPMVRGAIQVPPDGIPIVLGPDHPTTGGYPVLGVVASDDLDRVFATPPGGEVRFTRAGDAPSAAVTG